MPGPPPWSLRQIADSNYGVCANPRVRAGLVSRPEDGSRLAGSSYNEYAGLSADEQKKRCGLIVDRVRMPSDPRARI
jgi:hypothetical protein